MDKQHVLLYSTGNQIQHHVANNNGTEYEKVCVYIYVCVYVYNWIILLYSRNEYNIINQLYINKIIFCKKKKRKKVMVTKGNKKSSPISRHLQRSRLFGVKQLHVQDFTV